MRSTAMRFTAISLVVFAVSAFIALPQATAQPGYPTEAFTPVTITDAEQQALNLVICNTPNLAGTTFTTSGTTGTIGVPARLLDCASTGQVDINPTVWGPSALPANGKLIFEVPAGLCGPRTVTLTVGLITGADHAVSFPLPAGASAGCAGATAGSVPVAQVAFTGSDVSLPLTAGFTLVGLGGLMVLASTKRKNRS